jgi:hypothetical protein
LSWYLHTDQWLGHIEKLETGSRTKDLGESETSSVTPDIKVERQRLEDSKNVHILFVKLSPSDGNRSVDAVVRIYA